MLDGHESTEHAEPSSSARHLLIVPLQAWPTPTALPGPRLAASTIVAVEAGEIRLVDESSDAAR